MSHAWLDSLSEDWVSQPGSEASPKSRHQLPGRATFDHDLIPRSRTTSNRHATCSSHDAQAPQVLSHDSSPALSERSVNDVNMQHSRRSPSKLCQELRPSQRGRNASRSVSGSTAGSVIHDTVQHKSMSTSPARDKGQTPEWKRRLVYGDLAYGEHRDLFSSAGTGLENMFKPPAPAQTIKEHSDASQYPENETTMPSSPPIGYRMNSTLNIHVDDSVAQELRRPEEFPVRIQLNEPTDDGDETRSQDNETRLPGNKEIRENQGQSCFDIESRKVSGQSVLRNEDFSPIMVTRRNGDDGNYSYAPTELPFNELLQRLEKLRRNQMVLEDGSAISDPKWNRVDALEDGEKLEAFINFRRGGRSADGSFRHRLLSSALPTDTSEMLPEESLQASTPKQFPTIRLQQLDSEDSDFDSPFLPLPPHPSPEKRRNEVQHSPRSPLKLFGPYDSFTNQTLLRRISQFEEDSTDHSRSQPSACSGVLNRSSGPTMRATSLSSPRPSDRSREQSQSASRSAGNFGTGDLDRYEFQDDFKYNLHDCSELSDAAGFKASGNNLDQLLTSKTRISRDISPVEGERLFVSRRRQRSLSTASLKGSQQRSVVPTLHIQTRAGSLPKTFDVPATPKKFDEGSESKRLRAFPSKDPTPKRRRTLHKSDIAYNMEAQQPESVSAQTLHQQMQSIIGKRKDARHGDFLQMADPYILANRQILRPRAPTPSQRSSIQREEHPELEGPDDSGVDGFFGSPQRAHLPGSPQEVLRKPSIKTEDFINEANKIMAIIRSKAVRQNGLGSVEESAAENASPQELAEDSFEESTQEPFLRPPSREGPPVPRLAIKQEDPELVNRLKQYEERSEMGDIITSSLRSMSLARQAIQAAKEMDEQIQETLTKGGSHVDLELEDISDPPNIRITAALALQHRPSGDSLRETGTMQDGFRTNSSNGSSGHSTHRSMHTGSSRGSDSRRVIAPESVSHLIGDKVGNMVFHKDLKIWVKRRHGGHANRSRHNILPSEGSEDDPFASIPDLTVDMTMELQNLRLATGQKDPESYQNQMLGGSPGTPSKAPTKGFVGSDANQTTPTKSARSLKVPDPSRGSPSRSPSKMIRKFAETEEEGDVEHEITIKEDRINGSSPKRKNLTISFSSPVASIIDDFNRENRVNQHDDSRERDEAARETSLQDSTTTHVRSQPSPRSHNNRTSQPQGMPRGMTRRISVGGRAFVPRPISRIEERKEDSTFLDRITASNQELSIVGDNSVVEHAQAEQRRTSLSFLLSTPGRPIDGGREGNPDAAQMIGQYVGRLSLSPLSDFTAHPADQSCGFEVSYIVGDRRYVTGDGSRRILSQTLRDLVGKIAEIEPFEPFWEQMRDLDISNKRLSSLHKLDGFCDRLETLDASHNNIRNLNGVPNSVRHLKFTHNKLSELTAWGHLMNLQYIDISNNDIKSLSSLKNLVHLREIKADDNGLTSLDGIKYHDALQIVRARGNLIEELDFQDTELQKLVELDVSGNRIRRVANLDQLSSLAILNLGGNKLESFELAEGKVFSSLRHLDLSGNDLSMLDIGLLSGLRVLHADRNCLNKVTGLPKASRLDSLSLREQRGPKMLDMSFLSTACEVRKLFLSGNLIESFEPTADFLNLQLLELANCGLQRLPDNLGQMMPNLRKVNVNFNALQDVGAFRFVPRLKKLQAAGNRLADATMLIEVIAEFPHLAQLDLRDNPTTQGFYSALGLLPSPDREDSFRLPDADPDKDAAYCSRLDLQTKMRRRLYEELLATSCRRLRKLDGLYIRRRGKGNSEAAGEKNDTVWAALAAHGLVMCKDGAAVQENAEEKRKSMIVRPWGVEDSVA